MQKILIVDKDARMRQMVRQIVAGLAAAVCEAADGREAVEVCAAERPDWVLMDLWMKPTDGLRVTAQIKARFPETHIAILAQHDEVKLRAKALQAGACAYVLKENLHELTKLFTLPMGDDPAGNNPIQQQHTTLNETEE